jgi:hypothetical protein
MDRCVDNIDPETHLPDGSQQMTQARREPEQGGRNQFLLTQSLLIPAKHYRIVRSGIDNTCRLPFPPRPHSGLYQTGD